MEMLDEKRQSTLPEKTRVMVGKMRNLYYSTC